VSVTDERYDRGARVADNQRLARGFNVGSHSVGYATAMQTVLWVCECANATCHNTVEASALEYQTIHEDGAYFFVAPAERHYLPELERLLEHRDRYWIVETNETPAERATRRLMEKPVPSHTW
jgi:hypothetical protein